MDAELVRRIRDQQEEFNRQTAELIRNKFKKVKYFTMNDWEAFAIGVARHIDDEREGFLDSFRNGRP